MLGTSVAVTCHRICEMTAVQLLCRSLATLWKESSSLCPKRPLLSGVSTSQERPRSLCPCSSLASSTCISFWMTQCSEEDLVPGRRMCKKDITRKIRWILSSAAWVSFLLSWEIILIQCFSSKTAYSVSTWPKGFDEWKEKGCFSLFLCKISLSVCIGTPRQNEDVPKEVKQKPGFQTSSSMSILNYSVISKGWAGIGNLPN